MVSELEQAQQDLLLGIAKEKSAGARQVQLTSEDVIKSKAFGSDEARNAIELDRYAGIHRTLASIIDQGYAVEVSKTGRPIVVDDKGREAPEQQKLVSGLDKAQQDILYKIAKDKEAGEALTDEDILKSARKMQEVAYPIAHETRLTVSKNLNNIAEYARTAKEYTLSMRDRTLGDIEIRDSKGSEVTDPSQKSQILSILSFGEFSGVKPALKEEQEKMRRAAIDLVEDTVPLIADRIKDNSILVSSKGQVNILGKGERPIKDETEILERFSLSPKQMDKSSVSVLKEAAATAANPRDAAIEIEKKTLLPEIAAIKEVPVSPYAITEAGKPPYKPGSKEVTVSDYTAAVAENLASASPLMYSMTRSVEKSIFSTISGVSPAAGGAPIDALHRDYAASAQALAPKSLLGIGAPKVTKEAYSARASYMDIMTSESIKDPSFSGVSSATGIIPSLLSNMPIETRMLPKTPVVSPQELEKAILGKDYIAKLAEQDLEKAKLGEDYMAKLAKESAKQRYAEGKPPEEPEEPPKKPPERPKKGGKA
jgi:hypothetical protein